MSLSPIHLHYLKRQLVKLSIQDEFNNFNNPETLDLEINSSLVQSPLINHFFNHFILQLPFFTNNSQKDVDKFFHNDLHPFLLNFLYLNQFDSIKSLNNTKTKKLSSNLQKLFLILYNSGITYPGEDVFYQIKPKEIGQDKGVSFKLNDNFNVERMNDRINGLNFNIIGIRTTKTTNQHHPHSPAQFFKILSPKLGPKHSHTTHHFILKVNETMVLRTFEQFKQLHLDLQEEFQIELNYFPTSKKNYTLETLRLSLRFYIWDLLQNHDFILSNCEILQNFLFSDVLIELTELDQIEIDKTLQNDHQLYINHLTYQRQYLTKINELKQNSKDLKKFILDDNLFLLIDEFKTKNSILQLSPILQNFIEFIKHKICILIYQFFLNNSNSNYEFFLTIKKFHKLMPYVMIQQILKISNPMIMFKKLIDFLFLSPFGSNSIIQSIFINIFNQDLKKLEILQNGIISEYSKSHKNIDQILSRFKYFIHNIDDLETITLIKSINSNLIISILSTPILNDISPVIPINDINSDIQILTEIYTNLIKIKDKQSLLNIWSNHQLIDLLKHSLTLFYKPLIKLFKIIPVDKVFMNFVQFLNDLLHKLDELYADPNKNCLEEIYKVLTIHQDEFYKFLHDVYNNDKDGFFHSLILWIVDILNFLQISKRGYSPIQKQGQHVSKNSQRTSQDTHTSNRYSQDDKYKNGQDSGTAVNIHKDIEMVSFDFSKVDTKTLINELDIIIHNVKLKNSKYWKDLKDEEIAKGESSKINDNWEKIEENAENIISNDDFGINNDDVIDDFKIEETLEINKLLPDFKFQLTKILNSYK